MKTSALLMLSALVALGHWLVLVPGPDTLAIPSVPSAATRAFAPPASSTDKAAHALQTRRLEGPPLTLSVVSIAAPETRRPARPVRSEPLIQPQPPAVTEARPEPTATIAELDTAAQLDAALSPTAQPNREKEARAAPEPTEPGQPSDPMDPTRVSPAAQFLAPLQLPQTARLNYDIVGQSRGLSYRASGLLDWQQDGKHYDARMVASVFFLGSRTLTSQGEVTADGLAPTRFADKARSEQAAHFQPDKGKITFSANTPDAAWQRGAQDRLSVFFQLAGMLAGQPERVTPGMQIPVYTASARGADTWAFVVDGSENLRLPAGDMATLKLTRQSRMDYDQTVEIWFAPALSYWPVRIKVTQRNGDFADQQLASPP